MNMDKGDLQEFAKLLIILAETFDGGKKPSKAKTEIYFQALRSFPIGTISGAVQHIIQNRVYDKLPKPAEIIQAIRGSKDDRSLSAWVELDRAVRFIGPYKSVKFSDRTIHAIIHFWGGWPKLCEKTEKEWKFLQKDFERLYIVFSARNEVGPKYLIGIHEANNASNFPEDVEPPVFIGEKPVQERLLTS